MKNKHNIFFLILFALAVFNGFSQDLIVLKNGDKIYCKVISEDSTQIVYRKSNHNLQFEVKKKEVEKYSIVKKITPNLPNANKIGAEIFSFNFFGGVTNPLGVFASKDLADEKSGLANNGGIFHASVILNAANNFGFSVSYIYQTHKFDHKVIENEFNMAYPNGNFVTSGSNWKARGFFAGMHLNFPLKTIENLSLGFDVSAGLPNCELPQLVITGRPFGPMVTVTQYKATTKSFAFMGGMGLAYKASKNWAFSLNANYFMAKPSFSQILTGSTTGYYSYSNYEQKIISLNVEGGISFIIYKKGENKK